MRYFKKNSGDIRDNLSKKGMNHSPSTWEQFVCEHHESFETLRQELLDSQEGYCAYCEKRINIEKSHIDHYFPMDFSHYFRWLFANFRECSLIS